MKLLEVDDLKVHFRGRGGSLFKPAPVVRAVDGVSFSVERGKTLALVGESGSGKSTTALAVARLAQVTAGTVRLGGRDLTLMSGDTLRHARRRVQMVFQDPYSALNPRQRAGDAVRAPLDLMEVGRPRSATRAWPSCSRRSACGPSNAICFRTSSRAGNASASISRGRWPASPTW